MNFKYYYNFNTIKVAILTIMILGFSLIAILYSKKLYNNGEYKKSDLKNSSIIFIIFLALGTILRLVFAHSNLVHIDVTRFFWPWTNDLINNGISEFYFLDGDPTKINYFHDYTPLYMYVLYLVGSVAKWLSLDSVGMCFALRLPAIICDVIASYFIFKFTKKVSKNPFLAHVLALTYFFCPAVIIDSSLWGQVDGITSMIFIIALYFMSTQQDKWAIFTCMIGMLFKLQFVFVAPAIGVYYIYRWIKIKGSLRQSLYGFLYGIIAFIIVNIPFTYKIVLSGNILFPLKIYGSQISSYSYYTLNAFNLWGALGLNFIKLPENSLLSIFNLLIITLPCIATILYYKKKQNIISVPLLAAFVITFIFTFSFKMHERYMFGSILALLLILADGFDWWKFAIVSLIFLTNSINIVSLMMIPEMTFNYSDPRMTIYSILELISMSSIIIYMIKKYRQPA